ncbi:MAG: hypothetical protein OXF56_14455 [Rhodobacteraceae bacterium]|nr:hypothetical protein [Paracoccaceae bacterium]
MDARVARLDFHCDVVFARPAFSRVASFTQIIEPLYDAFDAEGVRIPSDALCVENGNSIATAKVSLSLSSGLQTFEVRLDGFEAHFLDLRSPQAVEQAKQFAMLFDNAVSHFLSDGLPDRYTITTPTWLTVDGGYDAAEALIRRLGWQPELNDPFRIGAQRVTSQATFTCMNLAANWTASIKIERSQLPDTHLFLLVAAEYRQGSSPEKFVDRAEHVAGIWRSVAGSIGLSVS